MMSILKLVTTGSVLSCFALPAMAQAESEVPYHPGKKQAAAPKKSSGGSHHYYGGPKSEVPHHIGPKKD
jgi:hypothetical protein